MNRSLSRAIVPIALLLPALWLPGCGGKDEAVITVGVAGPMTGDQSKMGQDFRNGVELAVEEWNGRGGVLGKRSGSTSTTISTIQSRPSPWRTRWSTRASSA